MKKYHLVLKNANVITMDKQLSKANWIAVKDGKIVRVGRGDNYPTDAEEVMDLRGKTVLPGFFDCHTHLMNSGLYAHSVNLSNAKNLQEALNLIEKKCFEKKDDSWVFGADYLDVCIAEKRFPNRWELDEVSHGHRILIFSSTMHCCAVNSAGLPYAKISADTPGVLKENGEINGIFASDESALLGSSNILGSLTEEEVWKYIFYGANHACENGITTLQGLVGGLIAEDKDLYVLLNNQDKLPISVLPFFQTWDVKHAKSLGLPRVGGCLTLDGAIFEHTMANFEPYSNNPSVRGMLYYNDQKVYDFVSEAHRENMQCTMHAVGERAIDQLLWIYHRVFEEQGKKDLRHRIEHFDLPTEKHIKLAVELGIVMSMQPGFSLYWEDLSEMFVGKDRIRRLDPFKAIIEAEGIICGGSDCPITDTTPLTYIAHCSTRKDPKQNISMTDALKMFTINGAYACKVEDRKGSIEVEKDADLVVIDRNPYEHVGKSSVFEMGVDYTLVAGEIKYKKV